jgi:hypothetical protein
MACGLMSLTTSAYAVAGDTTVACPVLSPNNGVFSADQIYRDSLVAIENGSEDYPVIVSLFLPSDGYCKKYVVAKYSHEGADPVVDSLFFEKIDDQVNLLTIVHWNVNHRGIGTFGNLYQVYAYKKGGQTGAFVENSEVTNNSVMTGIDGYDNGRPITFKYKTAGDIRKFLKKIK